MSSKEVAVKKYVVRLGAKERARLEAFIGKGKRAALLSTRARILLKADVSEAGDGWSDSRIAEALDTSSTAKRKPSRSLWLSRFFPCRPIAQSSIQRKMCGNADAKISSAP